MTAALASFHAAILAYHSLAGPIFGLLVLGESLVLLGVVIPATPFLFLVGTLIGSGELSPLAILPWALAGAWMGYWLSWLIGRRSGHRAYRSMRFQKHRRGVARSRLYFRRWGGPSLVFGRYVLGPFQSFLPFVAGASAMPSSKFYIWNGISAVVWVFVVLTPGFLIGRGIMIPFFGPDTQAILALGLFALSVSLVVIACATLVLRVGFGRPLR